MRQIVQRSIEAPLAEHILAGKVAAGSRVRVRVVNGRIRFGGDTVLTEVIDNELAASGRQFELTPALAQLVGLDGTQEVEWRYATRP